MSAQSFSVVTNLSSLYAQQNLYTSNSGLNKTIGRISSGYRVVDAGDDAAGLAISNRLGADVYALDQAYRNANDGSGIIQIADGALSKVTDLLNRAVTLAEQSASGTIGDSERKTIDVEYNQIKSEIDRIFDSVNFKGTKLFSSSAVKMEIFVGDTTIQSTITLSVGGAASTASLGLGSALTTAAGAKTALGEIRDAIGSVSRWRGVLGAQQNRLTNSIAIIQNQATNLRGAQSIIKDANMAEEMVNMTKYQILMQSGMSALSQANASSQMVLSLFQ